MLPLIVTGAGCIACGGTRALIPLLRQAAVLDTPNARSSHIVPTPRGGGIAVTAAIVAGWALLRAADAAPPVAPALLGAVLLAVVSWIDDLRGLPPSARLFVQFVAVGLGMALVTGIGPVFQGWLPPSLDAAIAALGWIWFINLFNFMDGIDGIAGGETAAIGVGLSLFAALVGDFGTAALSGVVAAAAIGFLVWNWAPARIFLGDVGSVPLGYVLGLLLLQTAASGYWKIALILPLYFLADATITLARRLARGERVWQAHREHFYQRAVQRGLGHAAVVRRILAADLALIALGLAAERGWATAALAAAVLTVIILLAALAGLRRTEPDPIPAINPRLEEPPA